MDQPIIIPGAIIASPIWPHSELSQLRPGGQIPVPPSNEDCVATTALLVALHALPCDTTVRAACIRLQAQVAGWQPAIDAVQPISIETLRAELAPLRETLERVERLAERQEGFRVNALKRSRVEFEIAPITVNGRTVPPDYPEGRVARPLTRWNLVETLSAVEINCWMRFYGIPIRGELDQKQLVLWEFLHGNHL